MSDLEDPHAKTLRRFLWSFRRHVDATGMLDTDAMRRLARTRDHRWLVTVPEHYEVAFRLMWRVPASMLRKVLGVEPQERSSGACVRHRVERYRVCSWTVTPSMLARPDRGFTDPRATAVMPDPDDGYVVLLAREVAQPRGHKRVFWLNPDELYSLAEANFDYQNEVVSVGSVGRVWMAYARARNDGDESWDDLIEWVVARAPPLPIDVASACRMGR